MAFYCCFLFFFFGFIVFTVCLNLFFIHAISTETVHKATHYSWFHLILSQRLIANYTWFVFVYVYIFVILTKAIWCAHMLVFHQVQMPKLEMETVHGCMPNLFFMCVSHLLHDNLMLLDFFFSPFWFDLIELPYLLASRWR